MKTKFKKSIHRGNLIKSLLLTLFLFTVSLSFSQAITTELINVAYINNPQNAPNINNCGVIDLITTPNTNLSLQVKLTKSTNDSYYTTGYIDIIIKPHYNDIGTGFILKTIPIGVTDWIVNNNIKTATIPISNLPLPSDFFDYSNGILFARYNSSDDNPSTFYKSCEYDVVKNPRFTMNNSNLSIPCANNTPVTFIVTNVHNHPGNLSYNWEVGSGWEYQGNTVSNFTTSTNSVALVPTSFPPSDVKVIPVLNGIPLYPQLTSTVSLGDYNPSNLISGLDSFCSISSTTYSVNNLPSGTIVSSWNSSNTNVATITSINTTQAILTKQNVGGTTISATIENSCGQQKIITKQVWTGEEPNITVELIPDSNYVFINLIGTNNFDINNQGITSTTWEKISGSGDCSASLNGSSFQGIATGNCSNWSIYAKITATNSCGTTTIYRTISPPAPKPCDDNFRFSQNPMKSGESINQIIIDPCENTYNKSSLTESQTYAISIHNIYGKKVYSKSQKDTQFEIGSFKKGFYIVRFKTRKGNVISKKLIIE